MELDKKQKIILDMLPSNDNNMFCCMEKPTTSIFYFRIKKDTFEKLFPDYHQEVWKEFNKIFTAYSYGSNSYFSGNVNDRTQVIVLPKIYTDEQVIKFNKLFKKYYKKQLLINKILNKPMYIYEKGVV